VDLQDLWHRIVWTFVQAFVGTLTSLSVADVIVELDLTAGTMVLLAAIAAGVGDVLVVVKEYARSRLDGSR
jgi:hypothetical protein